MFESKTLQQNYFASKMDYSHLEGIEYLVPFDQYNHSWHIQKTFDFNFFNIVRIARMETFAFIAIFLRNAYFDSDKNVAYEHPNENVPSKEIVCI